ncbi:hypothetical protein BCR32DRAFT_325519, partial [Anaeromyces robustus]
MTKMESSSNLINNLLLNLDNLKLQAENKTNIQNNDNFNIQEQLELLKSETQRLTQQYQYTQTSNKNNKTKKIPPPIITGQYKKKSSSQSQTIDDLLLELNNASFQAFGRTPAPKSGKSRKNQGSFIDPRRYSDPYKYTILSTLDETEDDEEEEEENNISNTPRTPKTALPYYGRKNNKNNSSLSCNTNLKLPLNHYISPKSAGARLRSYSQPEHYSSSKYSINGIKSSLHETSTLNNDKPSTKYFLNIKNMNEKQTSEDTFVKPPRSSSINKHGNSYIKVPKNYDDYSSSSEVSDDSEPSTEQVYKQNQYNKTSYLKCNFGLENKSSFQSDVTLVNEDD